MGKNRSKNRKPLLENVTITDIASEGKAFTRVNDMALFVPYVIPGDVIDVQVYQKRRKFMEGRAVKFHTYSTDRIEPFCSHFGTCGGCKWQLLPYSKQLFYKEKQVVDQLTRIGKIALPNISPILGSAQTEFYRNKLEFTFSNKRWLTFEDMEKNIQPDNLNAVGFHIPGMFDKIVDVEKCWLQAEPSNSIRNAVRDYALENKLTFFDLKAQEGFLRTMIVRTTSTDEVMLIMAFFREDIEAREKLLEFIADKFPEITSLMYVINEKANDTITDQEIIVFKGRDHIIEEMEGLKFKIGPKSFYQTNSLQAYELYKVARDFAGLTGSENVYDLYTGTGTIANFIAKKALNVIGIEYVPEAIEDAKVNAELNDIKNTSFYAGDMKDILTPEFITENGAPDVIITDPPRAGMHEDVVKVIMNAEPQKIVYVSCNPATQARDLQLMDEKYKVTKVQAVDMFPHTHHVENVVLLEKK